MRALLQRVRSGSVIIDGAVQGKISQGLVILLGVGKEDGEKEAFALARKTANLRIFEDENGKMNLSIKEAGGSALVVSQFTLYADTRRGNRPGFELAAPPEVAKALYEIYVQSLQAEGLPVCTGVFQADMQVELVNDGPVTILLEAPVK